MTAVAVPHPGLAGAPRRTAGRWRLMVPTSKLARAFLLSLIVPLLLAPAYVDTTAWIGLGLALTVFTSVHALEASYRTVWLPGVMTVGACVQWVLAAWVDYGGPSRMAVPAPDYFRFATLTTLAFVLGLFLPLWKTRPTLPGPDAAARAPAAHRNPKLVATCKAMVIGGVATRLVLVPVMPLSLRFAASMAATLAFVGALALLLLAEPRWPAWLLAAFAPVAFANASDLQFLEALQYIFCAACIIVYRFQPRRSLLLLLATPTIIVFLAISAFKAYNRDELRQQDLTQGERATATSKTLIDLVRKPSVIFSTEVLERTAARLNEGWITSRLLAWTPTAEPYAGGETISTGIRAALVPRILDPGKFVVGGQDIIPRFTGITLLNGTAMGLSLPGEMYANFGLGGAVAGTFLYAVVLGLLYRSFIRRARASVLWWAWAPFIFFSTLSAEQGFAENANALTKTLLIMWVIVKVVPAWRAVPKRLVVRRLPPALASLAPTSDGRSASLAS